MELNRNKIKEYYRDTDVAYKKLRNIIIALSQKVLRFTTQEERNRVLELLQIPF